jgi:mono/diheme cytochrome c family protein
VFVALMTGGCGAVTLITGTPDLTQGKKLFVQKCGTCHTLADAKTTGAVGPNLDAAFCGPRAQGMDVSGFPNVVLGQIFYPEVDTEQGKATGMPAQILVGQQARDVAAYVGKVAGFGDCSNTPSP